MTLDVDRVILNSLTADPPSPANGEMWYRSDLDEYRGKRSGGTEQFGVTPSAGAQARRTTNLAVPVTFTDIDFATTDFENDSAVVDHDDVTNLDRITAKVAGFHIVTLQGYIRFGGLGETAAFQLRKNDTTVIPGSEFKVDVQSLEVAWVITTVYALNDVVENNGSHYICIVAHTSAAADEPGVGASWTTNWDQLEVAGTFEQHFTRSVMVELAANDFLSWQISDGTGEPGANLQASTVPALFSVISMAGQKGDQGVAGADGDDGADGADGADGDVTWDNQWVISTVYTANQAVENLGSSYVCILGHTASASDEPGVGASWETFWDLMAKKGALGAGSIHRHVFNGKLKVTLGFDGAFIMPAAGTITRVTLWRRTAGSSGSTIVDVHKNGTTIYTTQGNRPTVTQAAGNDAIDATTDFDVSAFAQDDRLEVDVDAIEAGNPLDLAVIIEASYT